MSIDLNSALSTLSLLVAVGTALASHHYFKRAERQRDEDLLRSAIAAFTQYRVDAETLKRERKNTGQPISDREQTMFNQTDLVAELAEGLEGILLKIIERGDKLSPEIRSSTLSMVTLTERFSVQLQMISARLQNVNNNQASKLHELQDRLPKLESLLRSYLEKS
ncbi:MULTISPECIES: hypothetical protein [unclassified Polaromonas]|uniref:hypothetical protein n=1 Tax=unclassified Polaromonas TaxID=2638319 RepID=UPI000F07B990|nr:MULTISPECIES: hypothetical protein [unclassified Polaromonas]AYQ27507.1 hypothetical protein DT070_05365 [Polaromonas sp. SP1]QGJ17651.1 hypothetical protein F7R28_04080 [Polaromonas sp. Pch-P]